VVLSWKKQGKCYLFIIVQSRVCDLR